MSDEMREQGGAEPDWLLYSRPSGSFRWHAWAAEGEGLWKGKSSLCGLVTVGETPGGIADVSTQRPDEAPEYPLCKLCLRRLDSAPKPKKPKKRSRPKVIDPRFHTDEPTCACDPCRESRKVGARKYLERLEAEVSRLACSCVRKAVEAESWDLRDLTAILTEGERRLRLRLFLWETTGDAAVGADAGEARSIVLEAWGTIRKAYGGAHSCGATQERGRQR